MSVALADGLPRKLAIKPGMRAALLELPDGYAAAIRAVVASAGATEARSGSDAVLAFATTMADLRRVAPLAIAAWTRGGPLWIAYPKGGSGVATDLKRDVVWPVLVELGFRPIQQIAVDPVWTALRFRPLD